jgi:SAM-dependent methyltransferase
MPAKKTTGSKKKKTTAKKKAAPKKTTAKKTAPKKAPEKKPVEKPVETIDVGIKVEKPEEKPPVKEKVKAKKAEPLVPWNEPHVFENKEFGNFKENAFRVSGTNALVEVARKNVSEEPRKVAILHVGSKCYSQLIFKTDETVPIVVTPNGVPSTSDKFDVVVCENMFSHIENVDAAFKGALSILKKGGLFIAMVPTTEIPNRGKRDLHRFTVDDCTKQLKGMNDVEIVPFGMNKDKPFGYCMSARS